MYYDDFYFLHEEELFSDVFKTIYMYCSVLCLRLGKKNSVPNKIVSFLHGKRIHTTGRLPPLGLNYRPRFARV